MARWTPTSCTPCGADVTSSLPALGILVPVLAACLLLGIGRHVPRLVVDAVATAAASTVVLLLAVLAVATGSGRVVSWIGGWSPRGGASVGVVLVADQTGAALALLCAVLTLCALVYSWRYYASVEALFHVLMLLFLAGLVGYALTGDLFNMFVFFELMGAVAYALTGLRVEEPESVQGAFNFGVINSLGAYVTLMGIGVLYARTGQLGLAQIGAALPAHRTDLLVLGAFVLVCTGWVVKAAVVPFHFWLADAHAVAPTPVCVLFSGVMAPLGVYGVIRVYWTVFRDAIPVSSVQVVLLTLGVTTAAVGAVMCALQSHLKRMLAYSTISHIGLFLIGFAALTPSSSAGSLIYIAAHAGVKAALFLLAGLLLSHYGRIDEVALHGRARHRRVLGVAWMVGALALAGLPPFGTGLGKAIVEDATGWAPLVCVMTSAITGGAVLRVGLRVFYGFGEAPPGNEDEVTVGRTEEPEVGEPLPRTPFTMLSAIAALLALGLATGVVPPLARYAGRAGVGMADHSGYLDQVLHGTTTMPIAGSQPGWTGSGVVLGLFSTVLAAGFAFLAVRGIPSWVRALGRRLAPAGHLLHRLHSGHIGDYVAWLVIGVAVMYGLAAAATL